MRQRPWLGSCAPCSSPRACCLSASLSLPASVLQTYSPIKVFILLLWPCPHLCTEHCLWVICRHAFYKCCPAEPIVQHSHCNWEITTSCRLSQLSSCLGEREREYLPCLPVLVGWLRAGTPRRLSHKCIGNYKRSPRLRAASCAVLLLQLLKLLLLI